MVQPDVNYLAVLVAAIVGMVLGFLWYGPIFGNIWMKLMNIDKKKMEEMKKKGVGKSYFVTFIAGLVMAYVLSHFVDYLEATTISAGITAGFWIWLGFVATVIIGSVLWEGKPFKLYLINAGFHLAELMLMGAILSVWT